MEKFNRSEHMKAIHAEKKLAQPEITPNRAETREGTGRRERIPLGVPRQKLAAPKKPGFVRRWLNDTEGRLHNAQEGGYQFVKDPNLQIGTQDIDNVNRDLGTQVSRVVDKTTGQKAYLMEISEEFYAEDQALKAQKISETDRLIKHGKLDDGESRYVPKGGISIETR